MKTTWIVTGLALLLPLSGMADVTINAFAQDGGIAYLYDSAGDTFGDTTFSGGVATIPTAGLNGDYGIAISYAPGQAWYSHVRWGTNQYKTINGTTTESLTALTGSITSRSLSGSAASVTLSSTGNQGAYDNENNELDAGLALYRPAITAADAAGTIMSKKWDGSTLGAGYGYTTAAYGGYSLITITNTVGSFDAQYVADDLGGETYNIHFLELDKTTSVWTDPNGTITSTGNDVTFGAQLGDGNYTDKTPYYVLMGDAWMYDDGGNYSETYDMGLSLTNPDYYVIPEPAVLSLMLGLGGALFATRRIFMI